jgi:CDP-glucose 4,6-dehydratase
VEGLEMNGTFWAGKRVLLTGHTGFKGGWMALWLKRLGAKVTGYSLGPPTKPSLFDLAQVAGAVDHQLGDVRDLDRLRAVVASRRPEIAIHMAAQPLVRLSYDEPVETYTTNITGTVNFLEALRQEPCVRAAVVVTSDKCYENLGGAEACKEGDPLGGHDPYSNSKACAELVTAAYRDSYFNPAKDGLALASARAGNVVGGGDWAKDRLVPDIMHALMQGKAPHIRNPEAVRPWQHVLEPLGGYLLLAERLYQDKAAHAGAWNFGPGREDEQPVRWIVDRLCELTGAARDWQPQPGEHPKETHLLRLDSSKARRELGWRPRWSLDRTLQAIVEWNQRYQAGDDVQKLVFSQIEAYEKS